MYCTAFGIAIAVPGFAQERALSWGYNTYGLPGLIDMPSAHANDDASFAMSLSTFANQTRGTVNFQVSKRLSAAFRYSTLYDIRSTPDPKGLVYPYIFDRSFSLHYQLFDEGRTRPAIAIGINDLLGTGIYGGEYVVATKTVAPRLRGTVGLGWGRLGSHGGFSNPLASVFGQGFKTRPTDRGPQGGTFEPEAWFRGDAAFFGGIEWQATDKLRFVAEYSSDAYLREDGAAFDRKSPLNFGVSYNYSDRTTLSANYLYGSELGFKLSYVINPRKPRYGSGNDTAPPPILPASGATNWLNVTGAGTSDKLREALSREGVSLEGMQLSGNVLRLQIRNDRYSIAAQAVGRTARILTRLAPPEVETFDIRLSAAGMPVTSVVLRRQDMEDLEFHPLAPDLLRSRTLITEAQYRLPLVEGRYPVTSFGLEPYLTPSLFDPDSPLRLDAGVALKARYEPVQGLVFSGTIQQKLAGNLDDVIRLSNSVLPRVRSDAGLYAKGGSTAIMELTAAYYFRPTKNLFGRVTVGYLESMFGGVSTELLWKPQSSRLAIGAEVNLTKQRDFDRLFGFRNYQIATGHLSAYYDLNGGYKAQLDVGRYLAGDVGATLTLAREFENGWRIGAYATLTNVSAADFGEGSFDKGIVLTVPIDWVTGKPTKRKYSTVIRSVQRDGGARLDVSGRLYEMIHDNQSLKLDRSWGRVWR